MSVWVDTLYNEQGYRWLGVASHWHATPGWLRLVVNLSLLVSEPYSLLPNWVVSTLSPLWERLIASRPTSLAPVPPLPRGMASSRSRTAASR